MHIERHKKRNFPLLKTSPQISLELEQENCLNSLDLTNKTIEEKLDCSIYRKDTATSTVIPCVLKFNIKNGCSL